MTNLKHYLPHLAGAIVGSVAGWLAAGEFVARVPISDTIRIGASGGLLLLAGIVGFWLAWQMFGRRRP